MNVSECVHLAIGPPNDYPSCHCRPMAEGPVQVRGPAGGRRFRAVSDQDPGYWHAFEPFSSDKREKKNDCCNR